MEIAVIGAGVSGLTCACLLAEQEHRVAIFAERPPERTTSAVAAAMWFPYDCEPVDKVIAWSLATYRRFVALTQDERSGVSMLQLQQLTRTGALPVPPWAADLGARKIRTPLPAGFTAGYEVAVPLADTSIYLPYLQQRCVAAGVLFEIPRTIRSFADVPASFQTIVNCSGLGARELAGDDALEPHRGQVLLADGLELSVAIVCDDPPLMYVIPRAGSCVLGGTNQLDHDETPRARDSEDIISACSQVAPVESANIRAARVGLRPFRSRGIRLERESLTDGRSLIHNYGHGGSGFTVSWGCADDVAHLLT